MQDNHEHRTDALWPTSEQVFFRSSHPVDLIGRAFRIGEPIELLCLIGDLLAQVGSLFDGVHLRIELPSAECAYYLVEVSAMSTDHPAVHALPGVRALPSYLQGCLDAYRKGSEYMPRPVLLIQCHKNGEFWERRFRPVDFTEDYEF